MAGKADRDGTAHTDSPGTGTPGALRLWPPEPPHDDPLPLHRLEVPAPHILPFAIGSFDTIGPLSRAGFPHRHTFHEIVHVTGGEGSHVVDLAPWPVRPPQLTFVVPGQVHHWQDATGLRGRVVLFDDDFLIAHPGDRDALRALGDRPVLPLSGATAAGTEALLRDMEREYRERAPGHVSVLQSLLHILVVRALRLPGPAAPPGTAPPGAEATRAGALARDFARLLATPGRAERTVTACAARLGVTVGHLNEAVKQSTGRTPGRLIRQVQTLEAKRLLAGTGLTVGQVAREIGFDDPAYFCRFFRRETGTSPGAFRRTAHGNHHDRRIESIDRPGAPA